MNRKFSLCGIGLVMCLVLRLQCGPRGADSPVWELPLPLAIQFPALRFRPGDVVCTARSFSNLSRQRSSRDQLEAASKPCRHNCFVALLHK